MKLINDIITDALYVENETNKEFLVTNVALDVTDNQIVVCYHDEDQNCFVREISEFKQRFTVYFYHEHSEEIELAKAFQKVIKIPIVG